MLRPSLWEWIKGYVSDASDGLNVPLLREMERKLRFTTPWDGANRWTGTRILGEVLQGHDELMLNVTDFLVATLDPSDPYNARELTDVDQMLREGGSAYRVASKPGPPKLVRRVDPTLEQAATGLMGRNGSPGRLLADAWQEPTAYTQILATATARGSEPWKQLRSRSYFLPTATLRSVIASLRQGAHKWQFALTHQANPQRSVEVLVTNLALLWEGQYDRHVTQGKPLVVTQEEAETALSLAVVMVQWFTAGSVSRRT